MNIYKQLLFIFIAFHSLLLQANESITPTPVYLHQFPLKDIEEKIISQKREGFKTEKYFPFFIDASKQESDQFFGYHSTTVAHYIFQETVKTALEEIYGYHFPKDFYFLRTPGLSTYDIDGKLEFLGKFTRSELTVDQKRNFISLFFVNAIAIKATGKLSLESIPEQKIDEIYDLLLHYASVSPHKKLKQEEVKETLLNIALILAKQSQVNQAKIKAAFEEWVKNPLNYDELEQDQFNFVHKVLHPYDDTDQDQQNLLIALNVSLFANHDIPSESSVHIFAKGESVDLEFNDVAVEKISEFFDKIGINAELAEEIYTFASNKFKKTKSGILLQFFSDSPAGIASLDKACFVCSNYGVPEEQLLASDFVSRFDPHHFILFDDPLIGRFVIHPQLRVVITNRDVLNPFSWLRIKEHDLLDPQAKKTVHEFIQQKIRNASVDEARKSHYKAKLDAYWFR